MDAEEVRQLLDGALQEVLKSDRHLFETDGGERSIAARLAMSLQALFNEYKVDADYTRAGKVPKRLNLPKECAATRMRTINP